MRIWNKVALVMGGMTLLVLTVGLVGGGAIVQSTSLSAERYYADAVAILARWEVQRELEALAFTTRDYAIWDRTWAFVEAPDDPARDMEPEVSNAILQRNGFGLVAICRGDGVVLLGKTVDLKTGDRGPLPNDFQGMVDNLARNGLWRRPVKGFTRLDGRVWALASYPVTPTDQSAPPNGFLAFGKPLENLLEEINSSPVNVLMSNLLIREARLEGKRNGDIGGITESQARFPYRVYPEGEGTGRMRVDVTLYGLDGLPVALVSTTTPGLFFKTNQDLLYRLLLLGMLVGLLFTGLLYGLLTRLVSDPIDRLRGFIVGLDPSHPIMERFPVGKGGETAELAGAINRLLDALETVREREQEEQEALRHSEERFRSLFENMVNGVALHEMIFDASGLPVDYRYLAVNDAFERMTGLKREAILGRTIREVLPGVDPFWIHFFGEVARTGRSAETVHEEKELGRYYEVRAYAPEAGQFVAVFADVTERVLQEKQRHLLLTLTDRLNRARQVEDVMDALRRCFSEAFGETEAGLYRFCETGDEILQVDGTGETALTGILRTVRVEPQDAWFTQESPATSGMEPGRVAVYRCSCAGGSMVIAIRVIAKALWREWERNLCRTACVVADTTLSRVMSEERLRRRLELEALVTAASMRFMRGEPGQIREQIHHVLEDTGLFCGADQVTLLLGLSDGRASEVFRWFPREGMEEDAREPIDLRDFSWLYGLLRKGEVGLIDGVDSLPGDALAERHLVESRGWSTSSLRVIPLMSGVDPAGTLFLVRGRSPDTAWLQEDLPHLRIIGDLMLMAWQRARAMEAMRRRMLSLTNPPGEDETYPLDLLFDPEELQQLQDTLARIHNMYAIILDAEGKPFTRSTLPDKEAADPDAYLSGMISRIARQRLAERSTGSTYYCRSCGYRFWLAPIQADRKLLGYWVVGMPSGEAVSQQGSHDEHDTAWLEPGEEHGDAFSKVRDLVSQLARRLSMLAAQNIRQAHLLSRISESEFLQRRLFNSLEQAGDAILFCDPEGQVIYANGAADHLFDHWFSGPENKAFRPDQLPDARLRSEVPVYLWFKEPRKIRGELDFAGENGQRRHVAFSLSPVYFPSEDRTEWLVVCQDISRQKELEEQLIQSRKMEAIGNLASGVAHDFNNLLQVISGYAEILATELPAKSEHRSLAQEIADVSHRATGLTRQLLTFSRQQPMRAEPIDLNQCVTQLMKMLKRVLGEHITLTFHAGASLPPVMADSSHIDQVLINLCVNARDAMPDGGSLTIRTELVEFTHPYRTTHMEQIPRGRYVSLSVTDTGAGIPSEVLPRIFDPFFTTKEVGRGTGLGLATVYGIVTRHGGAIDVLSAPGRGTTMRIYIPALKEEPELEVEGFEEKGIARSDLMARLNGKQVLLAEDEAAVRGMTSRFLRAAGVRVVEAADGEEALERFREGGEFDALILDVIMPRRNGRAVFDAIRETHPDIPVIFCSGYSIDMIHQEMVTRDGCCRILHKPYGAADLLRALAEMLARPSTEG